SHGTSTRTCTIHTLSLHDALPIYPHLAGERANEPPGADGNRRQTGAAGDPDRRRRRQRGAEWRTSPADPHIARCPETYRAQFYRAGRARRPAARSEEHTSELQSLAYL